MCCRSEDTGTKLSERALQLWFKMPVSHELSVALALCILIRLARCRAPLLNDAVLRPFLEVDARYLDSLHDILTRPQDPPDPLVSFVQDASLQEERFPLQFREVPAKLPVLWGVWCDIYSRALHQRGVVLRMLSSAALVLSMRCLRCMALLSPCGSG